VSPRIVGRWVFTRLVIASDVPAGGDPAREIEDPSPAGPPQALAWTSALYSSSTWPRIATSLSKVSGSRGPKEKRNQFS